MNATDNWNDPDDYSLFLPDDAFNLFGESNLFVDFSNFPGPEFNEVEAAFQDLDWEQHEANAPDLENPSSMVARTGELIVSIETPAPIPNHSITSRGEPFQGRNSEVISNADTVEGIESNEKRDTQGRASKRKFFNAFSVTSGEEVQLHTRRPFSEERKKIVAVNRIIGVCLHCRLRKVAVSSIEPNLTC
jgi:hypothetical protein